MALYSGIARRNSQGYLADETGNDTDGDSRVRFHAGHDVVLLGAGFRLALVNATLCRLDEAAKRNLRDFRQCRYAGT